MIASESMRTTRLPRSVPLHVLLALTLAGGACRPRERARPGPAAPTTGPAAGEVVIRISYGSEKKAFLTDAIARFDRDSPKTPGGKRIRIDPIAEGSAPSLRT